MSRSNINLVGNTTFGQNVGTGTCIYKGKFLGNLLQFKKLSVTGTTMSITSDADTIYFSAQTGGGSGTVTSVTAGDGMTQTGTPTINPTLNIVSHAGSAGSIGTINIGADAIGVNLGTTSTTASRGDHAHGNINNGGCIGSAANCVLCTTTGGLVTAFTLPAYTTCTGTVTSVAAGNGMNFTTITGSGSVTMGTPSSLSHTSTNAVTTNSHTHAISLDAFAALTSNSSASWDTSVGLNKTWSINGSYTLTLTNVASGMYGTVQVTVTAGTPTITLAGSGITFKGNGSLASLANGVYMLAWVATSNTTVNWNIAAYA